MTTEKRQRTSSQKNRSKGSTSSGTLVRKFLKIKPIDTTKFEIPDSELEVFIKNGLKDHIDKFIEAGHNEYISKEQNI
jgi:hypothetical protein